MFLDLWNSTRFGQFSDAHSEFRSESVVSRLNLLRIYDRFFNSSTVPEFSVDLLLVQTDFPSVV